MTFTSSFPDDPLELLGGVLVVVGPGRDVGGVDGDGGLDLGLRLTNLVEKDAEKVLRPVPGLQLFVQTLLRFEIPAFQDGDPQLNHLQSTNR